MTRRFACTILIALLFGANVLSSAQSQSQTLIIENVGVSDEAIIPIVVSDSDAGIASGRKIIHQDIGLDIIVTHVVSADICSHIVEPIKKTEDDGTTSLKSFGTLRFVIVSDGKIVRSIFLGRENGIKMLVSLESIAGPGALNKDLAYLRYQITTATSEKTSRVARGPAF